MFPNPIVHADHPPAAATPLRRVVGAMSVVTMLMTIPQVAVIWVGHQAAGVSLPTWGTYLFSAFLWLWFGIEKRDKNIYLPCIGWIVLDAAVIAGAVLYGR